MLATLHTHFLELYSLIHQQHPYLAREHALTQEEDIYAESSLHSYRYAIHYTNPWSSLKMVHQPSGHLLHHQAEEKAKAGWSLPSVCRNGKGYCSTIREKQDHPSLARITRASRASPSHTRATTFPWL